MKARSAFVALLLASGCANAQQANQPAAANVAAAEPDTDALPAAGDNQGDSVDGSNVAEPAPNDTSARRDGRPWPDDIRQYLGAAHFCRYWRFQQVVRTEEQIAQIRRDCALLRETRAALIRQYAADAEVVALLRVLGEPDSF